MAVKRAGKEHSVVKVRNATRECRKADPKVKRTVGRHERHSRYNKNVAKNGAGVGTAIARGVKAVFWGCCGITLGLTLFFAMGLGLVHAYKYFTSSEYFAVKTIEIEGNSRLQSREVLEIVGLSAGINSLVLSIDAMEEALAKSPWVSELSIRRVLPDGIEIKLKEREPRFWVLRQGELYYADGQGMPIAPVTAGGFAALPTLEVEIGAEIYMTRLPEILRSFAAVKLPANVSSLTRVRLAASGVELQMEDTQVSFLLGLEDLDANLRRLSATLADLSRRGELARVLEIRVDGNNVWVAREVSPSAA